jgi:hypothetical protein
MSRPMLELTLLGMVLGVLHYGLARLLGMQIPFNIFLPWLLGGAWAAMALGAWAASRSRRRRGIRERWVVAAGVVALVAAINGKIPTLFMVELLLGNIDLPALEPPNVELHLAAEATLMAAAPLLLFGLGQVFAIRYAACDRPHLAYALHVAGFAVGAAGAYLGIAAVGLVGLLALVCVGGALLLLRTPVSAGVLLVMGVGAVGLNHMMPDRFFMWSVQSYGRISETRWSPYYKLDFVEFGDQCAATMCNNFLFYYTCEDPMLDHQQRRKIFDVVAAGREDVLIIGSSTGIAMQTIRRADPELKLGVGIEVDPVTVEMALGELAPYNSDVFHDPRIEVHAAEGRNWMDQEERRFDLVFLDGIDNRQFFLPASSLAIESYVFTQEGLARGIALLDDGGVLAMDVGGTAIESALPFIGAFGPDVTYDLYWYVVADYPMVGLPLFFVIASADPEAVLAVREGLEDIGSIERVEPPPLPEGFRPPTDSRPFIYSFTELFTLLGFVPLLGALSLGGVGLWLERRRPSGKRSILALSAALGGLGVLTQILLTVRGARLLLAPSAAGVVVLSAWLAGMAAANLFAERRPMSVRVAAAVASAGMAGIAVVATGIASLPGLVAASATAGFVGGLGWPALIERTDAEQRGSLLGWNGFGALIGVCAAQWAFPVVGLQILQAMAVTIAVVAAAFAQRRD